MTVSRDRTAERKQLIRRCHAGGHGKEARGRQPCNDTITPNETTVAQFSLFFVSLSLARDAKWRVERKEGCVGRGACRAANDQLTIYLPLPPGDVNDLRGRARRGERGRVVCVRRRERKHTVKQPSAHSGRSDVALRKGGGDNAHINSIAVHVKMRMMASWGRETPATPAQRAPSGTPLTHTSRTLRRRVKHETSVLAKLVKFPGSTGASQTSTKLRFPRPL
jgi:hypothetical protein